MVLFLHLLAAAFWLGGLIVLPLVMLAGVRSLDQESFRRFMRSVGWFFAIGSIVAWAVLGLTGFLLAQERIGNLGGLVNTAFGQRLSVKITLALVALVAAVAHTITGRSRSRPVLAISRALAVVALVATLGVFFQASRLGV